MTISRRRTPRWEGSHTPPQWPACASVAIPLSSVELYDRAGPRRDGAYPKMIRDVTIFLWLLKLGALVNLYFLANTLVPPRNAADPRLLVPAQILFAVSAFRCLFPNPY